jgi:hypothetical protein
VLVNGPSISSKCVLSEEVEEEEKKGGSAALVFDENEKSIGEVESDQIKIEYSDERSASVKLDDIPRIRGS